MLDQYDMFFKTPLKWVLLSFALFVLALFLIIPGVLERNKRKAPIEKKPAQHQTDTKNP